MLTKSDLKLIQNVFRSEIDPLKKDVVSLKSDVNTLKTDVSSLKTDVKDIKNDITDIKVKLNEFAKFTIDAISTIVEWTDDIHKSIVKEKLPQRIKKLEQILRTS